MKNDFRHRIVYLSAILACLLTSTFLLLEMAMLFPSLLFIVLLCVNIIPFKVLKSKGVQMNFGSKFRMLVFLNCAAFLPTTIYMLLPLSLDFKSLSGILLVATVVFIFALTGSLIFSPMPDSEPLEEDMRVAMYESKDMLLQPKPGAVDVNESKNYMPLSSIKQKSLVLKVLVWLLIILMVLIPFDWSFAKFGYHFWF